MIDKWDFSRTLFETLGAWYFYGVLTITDARDILQLMAFCAAIAASFMAVASGYYLIRKARLETRLMSEKEDRRKADQLKETSE